MSFFVRGAAIPNATAYNLMKKTGDAYHTIAIQPVNKSLAIDYGYITSEGIPGGEMKYGFSDFINVDSLPKTEGILSFSGVVTVSSYGSEDYSDFLGIQSVGSGSLEGGNATGVTVDAATLKSYSNNVKFIVLSGEKTMSMSYSEIFFCLDDYADLLPAGQTHHLVVKAIGEGGVDLDGDGIIYSDSDYGGDADGKPLEYTPKETDSGVWLSELLTGNSNAHDEFMAVANHSESLSNTPEYMYYEETIKSLLEGKKITRVACPNLGAGKTVTFYSNPWSTGTLTKEGRTELFTITGGADEATGGSNMTTYYVANPSAVKSGESVAFAVSSGVKMIAYDQLSFATPVKYAYNKDTYDSKLDKFVNFDFYLEV